MDDQVKDQLSKDVCYGMEKSLYRIQSSVFDVAGPLTGLWADLLKDERPNRRDVFRKLWSFLAARPLADTADMTVRVEAAVSDTLPMSVLLGTDVPFSGELLHIDDACAVVTRAQARRQEQECKDRVDKQQRLGVCVCVCVYVCVCTSVFNLLVYLSSQ